MCLQCYCFGLYDCVYQVHVHYLNQEVVLFRFVLFGRVLAVAIFNFLISKTKDYQYSYIVFGETNITNQ